MEIKDIENLAKLARIKLTEQEKKELLSDMDSILGYVKQIKDMKAEKTSARNASGIADAGGESKYGVYNIWRKDEIQSREFSHELIMRQFPDSQDGFLKVKKIL